MHCYLREYLALKHTPVLDADGDSGAIAALKFREPDWRIASILADFHGPRWLAPATLTYSEEVPPIILIRLVAAAAPAADGAGHPPKRLDVDADSLLGRVVLCSGTDKAGGRIDDLLINVHEWCLKYFVVDNGEGRVLLHASWVTGLSADSAAAIIDALPARSLLTAPRYPGVAQLTPGFLDTIYRHYTHREFNTSTG